MVLTSDRVWSIAIAKGAAVTDIVVVAAIASRVCGQNIRTSAGGMDEHGTYRGHLPGRLQR